MKTFFTTVQQFKIDFLASDVSNATRVSEIFWTLRERKQKKKKKINRIDRYKCSWTSVFANAYRIARASTPIRACHEKWIFFYTCTRGVYLKEKKNKFVLFENQIRRWRPLSERLTRTTCRVRWTVLSNTFPSNSKSLQRSPPYNGVGVIER